jgi:iron complex outermembrane receptor protein
VPDGWDTGRVGFRADWGGSDRRFTVQGDAYQGQSEDRPRVGIQNVGPVKVSGMNLLARWNEKLRSGSDIQLQAYFDRSDREDRTGFQGDVDTYDIEFQHGIPLGQHRILWGAGYRQALDNVPATVPTPFVLSFVPSGRKLTWQSVFVQDEFRLSERVELTAGVKLESNDYTGWETLPSVRLAWKPEENRLVWGAASQAVRAPARLDTDFRLSAVVGPVTVPVIKGGPFFVSEVADVFELGYRAQPTTAVSYSVTAFHSRYHRLRSGQPAPAFIQNNIEGFENGVEAWGAFQATRAWRLTGGFSTLREHFGVTPGSNDPTGPIALGNDPDHQWILRSSFNVTGGHELDFIVRRVGSVPLQAPAAPVPAYTAVDARWGWKVSRELEVSLTLQNMFDPSHPEFNAAPGRSEFERTAFLKLIWRM